MRLGLGLGCRGVVWGVYFKQYFFTSLSVVAVLHLSCISSNFVSTALVTKWQEMNPTAHSACASAAQDKHSSVV